MVLTAVAQYPSKAYAGMIEGFSSGYDMVSSLNNAGTQAGVFDLVFSAVNSAVYTADVYGVHLTYTADGSATLAEIRDGILAAAAAQSGLLLKAAFVASGNNVRVTELAPSTNGSGVPTGLDANTSLTTVTAHGEPEAMPAGIMVAQGTGYQDCKLMRASGDTLKGVTIHQHSPVNERLYPSPSTVNYPPNSQPTLMRRGRIWVPVEQVVVLTDTPFVRYAVGAGGTQLGAFRKDADSSSAVSLSGKAVFEQVSIGAAGSVALLRIDLEP